MTDRFPLIVDSSTQRVKELASGDNLDLTGSGIVADVFTVDTNSEERLRIDSSGRLGLGTITLGSNAKFEVKSTTGAIDSATIRINGGETATGAINTGSTLLFAGHDGLNGRDFGSVFAGKENGTSGNRASYLAFGTRPNGGSVTERMRIDSSGRLGVGTSSAIDNGSDTMLALKRAGSGESASLAIHAASNASSLIRFADGTGTAAERNAGSITVNHSDQSMQFGIQNVERMRIHSSGRVTFYGNSSSNWSLSAASDTGSYSELDAHFPTGNRTLFFNSNTANNSYVVWNRNSGSSGKGFGLQGQNFKVVQGSTEQMRIDSSGRMGLGTENPQELLHLKGSAGNAFIRFTDSDGTSDYTIGADDAVGSGGLMFYDREASAYRMVLDSSGRLLIGTTSGGGDIMLEVQKSGTVNTRVYSPSFASTHICSMQAYAGGRLAELGVYYRPGSTNAASFLRLDEEDGSVEFLWIDNSGNFRIGGNIGLVGTTAGTVIGTQTSDERLKNVGANVSYGLAEVKQLQPKQYAFKTEPDVNRLGFIAQEVESIIPEAVFDTNEELEGHQEGDRTKLGMAYVELIPVLVNAIKEMSADMDTLKTKVAALEAS